jgi:hypothetical protein
MTIESEARENKRIASRAEVVTGQDPGDATVGLGISVKQKRCGEGRKARGKAAGNAESVRSNLLRGNPG